MLRDAKQAGQVATQAGTGANQFKQTSTITTSAISDDAWPEPPQPKPATMPNSAELGKETQGTRTDLLSLNDNKSPADPDSDWPEPPKHDTRKEIAAAVGFSTGKVAQAEKQQQQV